MPEEQKKLNINILTRFKADIVPMLENITISFIAQNHSSVTIFIIVCIFKHKC